MAQSEVSKRLSLYGALGSFLWKVKTVHIRLVAGPQDWDQEPLHRCLQVMLWMVFTSLAEEWKLPRRIEEAEKESRKWKFE